MTQPAESLGGAERRRQARLPMQIELEYESAEDFVRDYCSNLSIGGMFIGTEHPLDHGTRFRLKFMIPGRTKPIDTIAEVRWVQEVDLDLPTEPGMGVFFHRLAPADRRDVEAMLEAWEAGSL